MYIHRIVIDANCINAKGRMDAMNELEAYHDSGIIEILKTTTIDAEFQTAPLQKNKATKYITIGGSCHAQMGEGGGADAMPGAVSGDSQFYKYYTAIFGEESSDTDRRRSLRDCLHIDQAILNNSDYFVTNEKALLRGGELVSSIRDNIAIVTPEDCLNRLHSYFSKHYGSASVDILAEKVKSEWPVILGSNTCFGFAIKDPSNGDVLLSSRIKDGSLIIATKVRNESGNLILEIIEGEKIKFSSDKASVSLMGFGPLIVGDKSYNQMSVGQGERVYLSVRAISSGRVLFDRVNLCSMDGQRKLTVSGEMMELKGLSLGPY